MSELIPISSNEINQMRLSVVLLLIMHMITTSFGQGNFLAKVRNGLDVDLRRSPVEKVYLHLDRTYYMTGETIYFAVYTTKSYLHKPSNMSNNIYVELFSGENKLLKRTVILVKEGKGMGLFDLNDSLKSGSYKIRAYSKWMQNFDPDYFFQKDIPVFSLYENQQSEVAQPPSTIAELKFFPEGGDLLYGIESKVGFKAVDANGIGIDFRGKIFDDQNKAIADIQSSHLGMGLILLRPEPHRTYYARVDGLAMPVALPEPKVAGYVLKVINNTSLKNIAFEIRTNLYAPDNEVTIVVQCRGRMLYSTTATIASGELNGAIPRLAFLSGVNHITIFDRNGLPVAERLFYVDRQDALQVKTVLSDTVLGKRKKVSLDIQIREKGGTPAKARLSLAATDDLQLRLDGDRETIASYLLLSSDIRGNVESPGYYFNTSNKDRCEALDILMLTQGWRRFVWKRIIENEPGKSEFTVEKGFHITGTMRSPYTNKPIPRGKVSFLSKDFKTIFGATETDAVGRFRVADIQVNGASEILFQGEFKKVRTDVWFDFDTTQVIPSLQQPICALLRSMTEFERTFISKGIKRRNIDERYNVEREVTLLDEVVIIGKKIPTTPREIAQASGHGYKRTIKVENSSWAKNPFDLLRGHATGLGDCHRPIRIYWEGVEIFSRSQLDAMDPNMVGEIDTACDLIAFWTKPGSYAKSATSFMLKGYQPAREFYSPQYNVRLPEHEKEDYRVTLHWQPDVQTDEKGMAHVEFYTSDIATTVSISIEGISSTGIPFVSRSRVRITD